MPTRPPQRPAAAADHPQHEHGGPGRRPGHERGHEHGHAHGHDHGHSHAHSPDPATLASGGVRAFALGTVVNLVFTLVEAGYGLATGSLALLSDALHNLGDVLGLALAWFAARQALRPASSRRTYGYRRATVLAPLTNAVMLVAGAGALGWEALLRLGSPPPINPWPVVSVAAIGIVVNLGSALLFRHGHAHDLNQRGAYLHLMADAAVSLAVVLGALGIAWSGWHWLDPLLALGVGVVVAVWSWGLLRDSLDLAMDAVPRGIEHGEVAAFLAGQDGVTAVHHLHIWALGSRETALTAHLVRPGGGDEDAFLRQVAHELEQRFGIGHATLQLERGTGSGCDPCT